MAENEQYFKKTVSVPVSFKKKVKGWKEQQEKHSYI